MQKEGYFNVNGRMRSVKGVPQSTIEGSKIALKRVDALRFLRISQKQYESKKPGVEWTKRGLENIASYNSVLAFAKNYASHQQIAIIEKMDPAKVNYMFATGVITAEEVFDYSKVLSQSGAKLDLKYSESIQDFIDRYNEILKAGRVADAQRKRNERARKRTNQ